jgi:hypothetical protein
MGTRPAVALCFALVAACGGARARALPASVEGEGPEDAPAARAVSIESSSPPPSPPASLSSTPPAPDAQPAQADIVAGPLVLSVVDSATAQTFHVVDHLSRWSASCHAGYARWAAESLPLDEADRAALVQHAALRRARGWGSGFEQAFYVSLGVEDAASRAVEQRLLTRREADAERDVLEHFAPRLAPALAAAHDDVSRFEARLRELAPRLAPVASKLARLTGVRGPQAVTVLPMIDPSPKEASGAAFAAGRLVVEIAPGSEAIAPALHELFRVILAQRRESIAIAAGKCKRPLDAETLEEAMATALSPGLVSDQPEGDDALAKRVAEPRAAQRTLRSPRVRFARLGLALRPLLAAALDGGATLGAFFEGACDTWRRLPGR